MDTQGMQEARQRMADFLCVPEDSVKVGQYSGDVFVIITHSEVRPNGSIQPVDRTRKVSTTVDYEVVISSAQAIISHEERALEYMVFGTRSPYEVVNSGDSKVCTGVDRMRVSGNAYITLSVNPDGTVVNLGEVLESCKEYFRWDVDNPDVFIHDITLTNEEEDLADVHLLKLYNKAGD